MTYPSWLDKPLGSLNGSPLTAGTVAIALLYLLGLVLLADCLSRLAARHRMWQQLGSSETHRASLSRVVFMATLLFGALLGLQLAGINLGHPLASVNGASITVFSLAAFVTIIALVIVGSRLISHFIKSHLLSHTFLDGKQQYVLGQLLYYLMLTFGIVGSLPSIGLNTALPFTSIGGTSLSVFMLAVFVATVAVVIIGSHMIGTLTGTLFLARSGLDSGAQYAIGRITYYVLLVLGMMTALQTIGVQLGSLTVLLGALGVGAGFGLQNIVNNFVSGLILLLERPIKVGDTIEIGKTRGRVTQIGARSTTVLTPDSVGIIIPNGDLTSKHIINWDHQTPIIRVRIPVQVNYHNDVARVRSILLEAAQQQSDVLPEPAPSVFVRSFQNALKFELAVYMRTSTSLLGFKSDLIAAVDAALRRHHIGMPVTQAEIQIRPSDTSRSPRDQPSERLPAD